MEWIVSPPNSYTEALVIPNVMGLGDGDLHRVIRIRWGHEVKALMIGLVAL